MKSTQEYIKQISIELHSYVENPKREAKIILSNILGCSISEVSLYQASLTDDEISRINEIVKRRVQGRPLQYILGSAPFMGLDFEVGPGVLIPRPETEVLVLQVVDWIVTHKKQCSKPVQIIDMCTGCGNIAISIVKNIEDSHILAADISEHSRIFVRKNLSRHQVVDCIDFIQSDMGNQIKKHYEKTMSKWDVLVSNPPYVPKNVYENMTSEVVENEPREALVSGDDGLLYFRYLLDFSNIALRDGGLLAAELFEDAMEKAMLLAKEAGYKKIKIVKDLASKPRIIMCQKNSL